MGVKSTIAGLVGLLLLAVAGLAVLSAVVAAVSSLLWGLTGVRFATIWFSVGLALTAGLSGYAIRQRVAGNVIPLDYDISVAFRGGQGGL